MRIYNRYAQDIYESIETCFQLKLFLFSESNLWIGYHFYNDINDKG